MLIRAELNRFPTLCIVNNRNGYCVRATVPCCAFRLTNGECFLAVFVGPIVVCRNVATVDSFKAHDDCIHAMCIDTDPWMEQNTTVLITSGLDGENPLVERFTNRFVGSLCQWKIPFENVDFERLRPVKVIDEGLTISSVVSTGGGCLIACTNCAQNN